MRFQHLALCAAALLAVAGLATAQEQGPINNSGATVAKPKKPADTTGAPDNANLPKIPSQYKKQPDLGNIPSYQANVDEVTLDVAVLDNKGQFVPGVPANKFRVLEDNVPQPIKDVRMGEAPITVAMVVEFSEKFQQLYSWAWFQTQQLMWGFASSLKPQDYIAVIAYDMHTEILQDFTTDRAKVQEALSRMQIPAWREANMFDAVTEIADRMSGIEGRKAIVLITTGVDTFSKITYDKARKLLQEAGVPIYSISLLGLQREMMMQEPIGLLQADNELRTFAKETGGQAFFPKFEGEYPGVFGAIQQALRNQYVITYSPTNKAHDGTFRKLKVDLVDAEGKPLAMVDPKGKPIKYSIVAKAGYKAPRAVE